MGTNALAEMQEVKYTHNNLTLNANLLMADDKGFADPMLLITHGTLTHKDRSTYTQLQENLAAEGVSSLSINLSLGLNDRHGEYDCNVPHSHKHTDAIEEIGGWLHWLQQHGTQKVTLVGHSRGGNQTAWYGVEQDSDMIHSMVLLAPATGEQQSPSEYQDKYGKPLAQVLAKAEKMISQGKGDSFMSDTDFIYCKKPV